MNEKTYRRVILILSVLCLVMGAGAAYLWKNGNNIRDDLERSETAVRAAREAQRTAADQLIIATIHSFGVEEELGNAVVKLELSQKQVGNLERSIENSTGAADDIRITVDNLGRLFEEGENFIRSQPKEEPS